MSLFNSWLSPTHMTTSLVLDALEQAIWTRARDGVSDLAGLVRHDDAGSQYTSIAFTEPNARRQEAEPPVMPKPEVVVPLAVREKAAQLGDAGAAWLSGLPDLIADLERRWSITIGEPLNGGTAAYVARTRTADGSDAVVKLSVPDPLFTRQIRTLAAARGRGYVHLLDQDAEHHAVLMEALGPPLNHLGLSPEAQIDTLCDMLPQAWQVPAPTGPDVEPALNKARSLADRVARRWKELVRRPRWVPG
jgi:hypothetical protein